MKACYKVALLAGAAWGLTASLVQAAEAPTQVEDIVVTARRVNESEQRTPVAVTAFSEKSLERLGAKNAVDLQGAVPNLNIAQGRGSSNALNIYIRGVGQPDALQTFDPAVGVYVDDVYYSRIRGAQFDLLDIDHIEVLRGPQGTLYGKNTPGGALKFVTKKADARVGHEYVSGSVGDYNETDVRGGFGAPLSSTVSVSLDGLIAKHDGYVTDPILHRDYNNQNTKAARAGLAFVPDDRTRLDLSFDYSQDDAHLNVGQATNTLSSAFGAVLVSLPAVPPKYNFQTTTTPALPNSTALRHYGTSATVTSKLTDDLTLKSITAYRILKTNDYVDIDATQVALGDVFVGVNQNQVSQELQLAWDNKGPLSVVGGLFFMREGITSHQIAFADAFTSPFTFQRTVDDSLKTNSYAAYLSGTYHLNDKTRLSAGLRYSSDEKTYFRTTSTFSNLAALVGTFAFNGKKRWTDLSPTVSLDYQASDNVMVYGKISEGYMAGGFNGRANNPGEDQPYAPEKVLSYEAGVKSEWMDRRVRLNAAIFDQDFKDFQARVSRSVTSPTQPVPSIDFAVLNAGKLNIYGAELELTANPVPALLLDAQVGYLHAEYKTFSEQRQVTPAPAPLTTVDRSFQTPAFSPTWTARFGGSYEFDLAGAGFLSANGAAKYRSKMALSVDNSDIFTHAIFPGMWQEAFWTYDASVVWQSPDRHYTAGVYGKNLSNEVYKTDAQEFSSVGGIRTAYYGNPRTWLFTLTARW